MPKRREAFRLPTSFEDEAKDTSLIDTLKVKAFERIKNIGKSALNGCGLMLKKEHEQIVEELRNEVEHDVLTGLYNKKYFIEKSDKLLASMQSEDEKAAIMLLDLDGFKQINDTYGHEVGDHCLKLVATCLRRYTRSDDTRSGDIIGRGDRQNQVSKTSLSASDTRPQVGRFGGDEFGIVMRLSHENGEPLPDPNAAATSIKQRLQTSLTKATMDTELLQAFNLNGIDLSSLQMSIGYVLASKGDSTQTLLPIADHNMYEEKRSRKNVN